MRSISVKGEKVSTTALAASLIVCDQSCSLKSASMYNDSAGDLYLQIFDSATLPAEAAVPLISVRVPKTDVGNIDFGAFGVPMSAGVVLVASSTGASKTIAAASALFLGVIA